MIAVGIPCADSGGSPFSSSSNSGFIQKPCKSVACQPVDEDVYRTEPTTGPTMPDLRVLPID